MELVGVALHASKVGTNGENALVAYHVKGWIATRTRWARVATHNMSTCQFELRFPKDHTNIAWRPSCERVSDVLGFSQPFSLLGRVGVRDITIHTSAHAVAQEHVRRQAKISKCLALDNNSRKR